MYAPEMLMGMQTEEESIDVVVTNVDPASEKVAERIGLPAPDGESTAPVAERKKRSKGVSASEQAVIDVPPTAQAGEQAAQQSEPAKQPAQQPAQQSEPAKQPDATEVPAAQQQDTTPSAENAPNVAPSPALADAIRCQVDEVIRVNAGNRVFCKVLLSGVKENVWYEGSPDTFPPVGTLVDVVIGSKPSRQDPAVKLPFIVSVEVIGR
jgi:hypothetical protein